MTRRLDNPESCFVCRRRADGLGVGTTRIGWLCQQCADGGYGAKAYAMPDRQYDEYENRALVAAGDQAGAYLDSLNETDLGRLRPEEYRVYCRTLIDAYGDAIRREVGKGVIRDGFGAPIYAHLTTEELAEQAQED